MTVGEVCCMYQLPVAVVVYNIGGRWRRQAAALLDSLMSFLHGASFVQ